ncbi:MAG: transporter substrate-binding domain-containing protein [Campylobacterota bacterium]|nr:transporter substrate-binding domain-containing protein [Campylobacterota bacterium]
MQLLKSIIFLLLCSYTLVYADKTEMENITLQLQWKHQFEFAGFYAAKEKGFYKDAGLDVSFVEFDKNKDITEEVLNGNAQYGLTYSSIIAEYMQGKPLILLANFFKQSPLVLVAQPHIRTPADLKGKKIMGLSDSIHGITLLTMLNKFNIHLHDIRKIPASFNVDDFINKKVDAMSVFTTNELYQLDKRGIPYTIFDPVAYGAKYYDANLFTSKKEFLKHPERVKRFREASIKGWEYALAHQEEMIDIILNKYNPHQKSKDALLFEAKQIEHVMLPKVHKIGSIDVDRVKMIAESFIQAGFIKHIHNRNIKKFIYNDIKNPLSLTAKESAFIKNHPKIVLGTEKAWKPYVIIKKDGTISGYDADVLKRINEVSGSNFVLEAGEWAKMQEEAKAKNIDGLSTGGIHDERKTYLNFSDIYISMRKMLIVSKENPKNIQTLDDLEGKTIAIHKSNLVDEKATQKFTKSKVIGFDTIEEVITSVATGKADAMFGNGATFYMANELGLPYLKRIAKLEDSLDLAFGIRKDWPEAISIINKSLAYIGDYQLLKLKNKWFWQDKATILEPNILWTEDEIEYLQDKDKITMCIDPNWMPLEMIKNGEHIGLSADYMKLVSSKTGLPITLVPTKTWSESITFFKEKQCDILSIVMQTHERMKFMSVTDPYLTLPMVLTTTNDKFFISNIRELQGKSIGIGKNYAQVELLKEKYPLVKFIEVDTISQGLHKVIEGALFGYLDNLNTIGYQIQKNFPTALKITGKFDEKLVLGIGVNNDDTVLLNILNKAMKSIDEQTKEKILNRWVSIKFEQGFDNRLFWYILTPFLLLALILLVSYLILKRYNIQLKKEVQNKVEELRHKDELLLKKYRMAAMGEMLSMIAHQWRQPLGAISSAIMGIKVKMDSGKFNLEDKNDRENLLLFIEKKHHNINEYVHYLATTTDDFRNFFNPHKSIETISLLTPIKNALKIVSPSMHHKGIKIVKNYLVDAKIDLYSNEVMQVILNLLKNSEDSLLEKHVNTPTVTITTRKEEDTFIISICDNGEGIPHEILDKIFDPYFSTKDEKNGAGLGLYMSKVIIEEHHQGTLKVINSDAGACFEIILNVEV